MDSGFSSRAADAVASLAKKAAPARAPAASPDKEEVSVPAAWGRQPVADGALASVPVMGGAEYWPALSGGMVMPAAAAVPKSKAPPASAALSPKPTRMAASIGNPGASRTGPGDLAAPAPAPERRGAVREQSPAHAPNHRSNGDPPGHQNGRSPTHRHGRSGHNGGGSRRGVGGGISIGNANANVYGSGGGARHEQQHRGGFDGQRHGRSHQNGHGLGHRQLRTQMPFAWAPHPFPPPPPPPPPPFFAPPMPLSYGAYYGPMIGYAHPEFVPGFYIPPPSDELHFMPYPALPVHVMLPHMEQQQAAQPHVEEQQEVHPDVEEPEAAQLSTAKLETDVCNQIEYYFSENNLCRDSFLKQNMNAEGWVPLTIVANFEKVKEKTTDLELVLKSVSSSTEVEVQDGKIRRRTGWEKYILRRH